LQRSSQFAAGDAISFRISDAYIKHREANIKHFLLEWQRPSGARAAIRA